LRKFSGGFFFGVHPWTPPVLTTQHTKVTKNPKIYDLNFVSFAPFVVNISISRLVAALPRCVSAVRFV
jgi:hypothetical protein